MTYHIRTLPCDIVLTSAILSLAQVVLFSAWGVILFRAVKGATRDAGLTFGKASGIPVNRLLRGDYGLLGASRGKSAMVGLKDMGYDDEEGFEVVNGEIPGYKEWSEVRETR
jgi:hypothetical protein